MRAVLAVLYLAGCDALWISPDETCAPGVARTMYFPDLDGDGYGDANAADTPDCGDLASTEGYATNAEDCDDNDPMVNPGQPEICGGPDQNCDGHVGSEPVRWAADCEHMTITSDDTRVGGADLVYAQDCTGYSSTILPGETEYLSIYPGDGGPAELFALPGDNNPSVALHPLTGEVFLGMTYSRFSQWLGGDNGTEFIYVGGDYPLEWWIDNDVDGCNQAGVVNWSALFNNCAPSSLVIDSEGDAWVPSDLLLSRVSIETATYVHIPLPHGDERVGSLGIFESVALDPDERVFVSIGQRVHEVDRDTNAVQEPSWFEANGTILDMVFDPEGYLYVSTAAGEIWRAPPDGGPAALVQELLPQGKLSLTPDGYLVHFAPEPTSQAPIVQEWALCQ